MEDFRELDAIFQPETVAVMDASDSPGKPGDAALAGLLHAGYTGKIIPAGPSEDGIPGMPFSRDVREITGPLDLALVRLPAGDMPTALNQLAALPARAVVALKMGKDDAPQGYVLDERLVKFLREKNILLLGPDSLGAGNPALGLCAGLSGTPPQPGGAALFFQSADMGSILLAMARSSGVGISKWAGLGSMAGIDQADLLEYLGLDEQTRVILACLEEIRDGRAFMRQAFRAGLKKPVIALCAGPEQASAPDLARQAAFRQCGLVMAGTPEELFGFSRAFCGQPLPLGLGLGLAADAPASRVPAEEALEASAFQSVSLHSPAGGGLPDMLAAALGDERVQSVLLAVTSKTLERCDPSALEAARGTARRKPVLACLADGEGDGPGAGALEQAGITCFASAWEAVRALEAMFGYARFRDKPPSAEVCWLRDLRKASLVFEAARSRGLCEASGHEARDVLAAYGLPMLESVLVKSADEAAAAARKIGYPVALRAVRPDAPDVPLQTGEPALDGEEQTRQAFSRLTAASALMPDGAAPGCLVTAAAPANAVATMTGFSRDPRFGPLILFGLGGIYGEEFPDASFRLAPLTLGDAQEMVREIRGFALLRGNEGRPPADLRAIEDIIMTMSQLALDFPDIDEARFYPVLAGEHGAVIGDCRFGLGGTKKG